MKVRRFMSTFISVLMLLAVGCGSDTENGIASNEGFSIEPTSGGLPNHPFKSLKCSDIESVSLEIIIGFDEYSAELKSEEIEDMVEILNECNTYEEDYSYRNTAGGVEMFTMKMADGSEISLRNYGRNIVINDISFIGDYSNLEKLCQLAQKAADTPYAQNT